MGGDARADGAPRAGESDAAAAVRAASELCDIDGATELEPLPLPPALIHAADGPVPVYALYARNAPPPGPLEDADATDDDDLYDWYVRAARSRR